MHDNPVLPKLLRRHASHHAGHALTNEVEAVKELFPKLPKEEISIGEFRAAFARSSTAKTPM
jgi:hypothetical protein